MWGELYRSGYHTGISHFASFLHQAELSCHAFAVEKAEIFEPKVRDAIRLLLLSYNASHATLMTRVVVKRKF